MHVVVESADVVSRVKQLDPNPVSDIYNMGVLGQVIDLTSPCLHVLICEMEIKRVRTS